MLSQSRTVFSRSSSEVQHFAANHVIGGVNAWLMSSSHRLSLRHWMLVVDVLHNQGLLRNQHYCLLVPHVALFKKFIPLIRFVAQLMNHQRIWPICPLCESNYGPCLLDVRLCQIQESC
jgi:hypothetical protein